METNLKRCGNGASCILLRNNKIKLYEWTFCVIPNWFVTVVIIALLLCMSIYLICYTKSNCSVTLYKWVSYIYYCSLNFLVLFRWICWTESVFNGGLPKGYGGSSKSFSAGGATQRYWMLFLVLRQQYKFISSDFPAKLSFFLVANVAITIIALDHWTR